MEDKAPVSETLTLSGGARKRKGKKKKKTAKTSDDSSPLEVSSKSDRSSTLSNIYEIIMVGFAYVFGLIIFWRKSEPQKYIPFFTSFLSFRSNSKSCKTGEDTTYATRQPLVDSIRSESQTPLATSCSTSIHSSLPDNHAETTDHCQNLPPEDTPPPGDTHDFAEPARLVRTPNPPETYRPDQTPHQTGTNNTGSSTSLNDAAPTHSAEPPPAYTPQSENGVPGGRSTVRVAENGSPVSGNDFVTVGVDLQWPDTKRNYRVRRGTKEAALKEISPVRDLRRFGENQNIKISPAGSATSETAVHVESDFASLYNKLKRELKEGLREEIKQDCAAFFLKKTKPHRDFAIYMFMRYIQDTVYYAMSRDLGKDDFKSWPGGFEELVDKYVRTHKVEILTPSDIVALRAAIDRDKANQYAYPPMKDVVVQELRWRSLENLLEDEGMGEEKERYGRYFQFAKSKLS